MANEAFARQLASLEQCVSNPMITIHNVFLGPRLRQP